MGEEKVSHNKKKKLVTQLHNTFKTNFLTLNLLLRAIKS